MKKNVLKYCSVITIVLFIYACTKSNGITNQVYSSYGVSTTQGQLKINYTSAYNANPSVLIKINDQVVSGLIATRTPFPGGGYNTVGSNFALYLSVPVGSNNVSIIRPKVGTSIDSIILYNATIIIPDNAPYTLHIADTLVSATVNATKSLLVKNIITSLDTGFCRFRFVNLIPNATAVDLYLNGILIKSNVSYLQATDTFSLATGVNAPGYTSSTPTWAIRVAGASPNSTAVASYTSANTLQSQFVQLVRDYHMFRLF